MFVRPGFPTPHQAISVIEAKSSYITDRPEPCSTFLLIFPSFNKCRVYEINGLVYRAQVETRGQVVDTIEDDIFTKLLCENN